MLAVVKLNPLVHHALGASTRRRRGFNQVNLKAALGGFDRRTQARPASADNGEPGFHLRT